MPKKMSSVKSESAPASEEVTQNQQTPDVVQDVVAASNVLNILEDDDGVEPTTNVERVNQLVKFVKQLNVLVARMNKQAKDLQRRVVAKEKRLERLEERKASNKKKGGSGGLKKLQPVYGAEFQSFIETHHKSLYSKGSDGKPTEDLILAELQYDDDHHLMVNREDALKLVNAYVKQNDLQQYEDKKRIQMNDEMKAIFPTLAEHTNADGEVVEENCYFHTLMKGISRNFKTAEVLADIDGTSTPVNATPSKSATSVRQRHRDKYAFE
jgi:hypothetical protein